MESRFTPLLSNNYVPTKDELNEIHNLLADPVDQLSQLDTEIAHLQSAIDKLTLKRNQLHAHIISHRKLMAPLRRIPEELLQEIFCHCLPVDHNAVKSCHEAPLILGRVCSQWRSVSQSTPRLWSGIHIVIGDDTTPPWPGRDLDDAVEAIRVWLSRSGELPLSISLYEALHNFPSQEYVDRLLSTLIHFSSRWKNISLVMPIPASSLLSSLSHEAFPLLETFSCHSTLPDATSLDIFQAPRIQTVSFYHLGMVPMDMDWSRLTSLSLGLYGYGAAALTGTDAFEILRKCPNLIYCSLDFTNGWGNLLPLQLHETVTLPVLETLSICEGIQMLEPFIEHLRLPVLVNLEFAASASRRQPDAGVTEESSIWALLSRLDSLKTLTLSALDMTYTALMSCLRHVPFITQLSVRPPQSTDSAFIWGPFTNEVAVLLMPTEGQPMVCPLLKVLECNPCDASDTALLAMIQQRTIHAVTHNIRPLEQVDVILHRGRDIDIPSMLPPNILAETTIALQYILPPTVPRRITPKAGLERPERLQIPSSIYNCMYH